MHDLMQDNLHYFDNGEVKEVKNPLTLVFKFKIHRNRDLAAFRSYKIWLIPVKKLFSTCI